MSLAEILIQAETLSKRAKEGTEGGRLTAQSDVSDILAPSRAGGHEGPHPCALPPSKGITSCKAAKRQPANKATSTKLHTEEVELVIRRDEEAAGDAIWAVVGKKNEPQ
jgi:hypothetical protein